MMATLVLSLAIVTTVFRLPLHDTLPLVGWEVTQPSERIAISFVQEGKSTEPQVPATRQAVPTEMQVQEELSAPVEAAELVPVQEPQDVKQLQVESQEVLEFTEEMPELVGGITNYYLKIDYPMEARKQGIQGRMLLQFVVEKDGSVTEIQVLHSLHPLCDSAAVRALKASRFIPGQQNGEPVRVRMRLPVRFELVNVALREQ